jgi:adenosine deaminase
MMDRALLRRLPKADLHCHLDGSVRPGTLVELARDIGWPLPASDVAGVRRAMRVPDGSSLEMYLSGFTLTLAVLQTEAALERVAYELAEDADRDGAWYLEVRFAPLLNTRGGLSQDRVIEAVQRGLRRAARDYGIESGIIVCALRQLGSEVSLEAARLAVAHLASGVVGFDLAGPEAGHPASAHATAFLHVREHGVPCTCHAGEGDGAASVRAAVSRCGAHRIGHGTRMVEDPALTAYVVDRQIPIEICLTSNVQTGVARDYATHPLRPYIAAGVPVVLCTDNRLMSDTTLTDEYVHAASAQGLSFADLAAVARNGFEHAFQPWAQRQALLRRFDGAVAELQSVSRSL